MENKKENLLQEAIKNIERNFGKGSIMTLGMTNLVNVNTIHSGSYSLDIILGGGYPEGRIIEIYGPEASGKTTLALHAIAEVQKAGNIAAFIDAEHALDPNYAKNLGVDINTLLISQPDYGEQALQIVEELAKSGIVKLIVVDSVAALVPKAEVEGEMGESFIGLQARMMSQGLRKLTSVLAKTGTTVIFLNQIRSKIGVMFGNPETTTGGNALKFFASQRLEIRKGEKIEESKEQVGFKAKIKVVKNKIAAPFKSVELTIVFNRGIDKIEDIIDAGIVIGLITKSGSFYSIGNEKIQGREKLYQYLLNNLNLLSDLENQLASKIKDIRNLNINLETNDDNSIS